LAHVQFRKPLKNAVDNTIAADAHKGKTIFRLTSHSGNQPAAHRSVAPMQTKFDAEGNTKIVEALKASDKSREWQPLSF
jgi:hypothetical protein